MKKLLAGVKKVAPFLLGLYRRNPARVNGLVAAAIVGLGAKFGIGLDASTVLAAVAAAGVVIVSAETSHRQTKPKKPV